MKFKRSSLFVSVLRAGQKQSRRFGTTQLLLGASLITLVGQQAKAQELFWNPKLPDASPDGTWNATDLDFHNTAGLLGPGQQWVAGSIANFQQVIGGTVTLVTPQTVLGINASSPVASAWILSGAPIEFAGTGANIAAGPNNTLTVASAVNGQAAAQPLQLTTGDGTVIVSGDIGGNIGTITSNGTITLSGTNTFTGPLNVASGLTTLSNGNAVADTVGLNFTGSAGTVALTTSETVGGLAGASAAHSVTSGGNTLTVQQNTDTTFAGVVSGTNGFTKSGTGSLTLSGVNSYTGLTSITAGTLNLTGTLASETVTVNALATLANANGGLVATAVLNNNGTVNQNSDDTILTLNNTGKIDGSSTLTATTYNLNGGSDIIANLGTGTVNANGAVALKGTSAAATFNVVTGTTTLGSAERLLDSTALTISAPASLVLGGAEKIGSLNGAGKLDNNTFLLTADSGTFSGEVLGTGGLTKVSVGTLTLSGINTYTGPTKVDAGILTLAGAGSLASLDVTVASGATLNDNNSGLAALTAATVNGTLNLGANEAIKTLNGSGAVALSTNRFTVSDGSFSGIVSSSAAALTDRFTKNGTGILTLSGANTYRGRTLVTAGTLVAANNQALGSGNGINDDTIISTGATVALGNGYTSNEFFQLNGNGDTANMALGALDTKGVVTLNGDFADDSIGVSGSTTVSSSASGLTAGLLTINGDIIGSGPLEPDLLTFSVAAGSTIDVNDQIDGNVEGIIKTGKGTLDLTDSDADYTNGDPSDNNTVITDGVIIINQNLDLGDAGNVLFNGSALELPTLRVVTTDVSNDDGGFDRDFILGGPISQVDVVGAGIDLNIDNDNLLFISPTNTLRKLGTGELNIDTNVGFVPNGNGRAAFINGILDPHTGTINVLGSGFSGVNPAFLAGGVPAPGTTNLTLAGLGDADGGQTGTINLGLANTAEFGNNNQFDIVVIDQTANTIFDGTLNTTGDLLVTGTGNLKLNGSVNTLGNIHISGTELLATTSTALSGNINSHDSQATFIWGRFNDPLIPTALNIPGKLSLSGGITVNERLTIVNDGILNNAAGINTIGSAVRVRFDGSLPFSTVAGPFSARIGATEGQLILQGGIFSNPGQTININGLNTDAGTVTVAGPIQSTVADVLLGNSDPLTPNNTVDLQVQNFYSGNTTINGGTVIVGNNQSLSGSDVTLNADANLKSSGNVALANDIALNATLTTGAAGTTLGLNGEITGTGGIANAGGTTTLGGNNTYTGATLVNAGTVNINGTSSSNDLQVAALATLTTGGANKLSDAAVLNVADTGTATLGGSETIDELVADGTVNSLLGDLTVVELNGATTGRVNLDDNILTARSGAFAGNLVGINAELIKNGGATLTLSGDNSGITGKTTVNNGILAANSLGSSTVDIKTGGQLTASGTFAATNINVAAGSTLQANAVIANTATINNSGTVNVTSASSIANLNLNDASGIVNLTTGDLATKGLNGSGTLNLGTRTLTAERGTFEGTIDGAGGLTKVGGTTLTLSGTNSYIGETNVDGGTLALNTELASTTLKIASGATLRTTENEQLADTANLTTDGTVNLGGSETIATLVGSGIVNVGANSVTLTAGGTYSGKINGTGETILSGGTFEVGGLGAGLNTRDLDIQSGSTLTTTSTEVIANNTRVNNDGIFNLGGDDRVGTYTSTGTLNGRGKLTASTYALNDGSIVNADTGSGIITTNGAVTLGNSANGNTTSTGASAITVQTGVLDAYDTFAATQIGVNSGATLNSNGMLATAANVVVGGTMNVGGTTTIQTLSITPASGIVNLTGGSLITKGLNGSGTLNLGANNLTAESGTFSGTIDGAGSLTKEGGSTLTLAGTNSYTGDTNINAGTLSLQSDLASSVIRIANNAFLTTSEADQLKDTADVYTSDSGTLDLGGSETIGSLFGNGSVILGTNTLTLANGGDFSGNIGGTGEIILAGGALIVKSVGGLNAADLDIKKTTTLTTDVANLIGDSTNVNNDGTLSLGGNDTVGSYTSTGTLNGKVAGPVNGPETLTAATYNLNDGSIVNANTGAGIMTTNGVVNINSASTLANEITVKTGTLNAGTVNESDTFAATKITVDTGATLNSNGILSSLPTLEVSGIANLNTNTVLTSLGVNAPGLVEINGLNRSLTTTNLSGDGTVDLNANTFNVSQGAFSGTLLGTSLATFNKNGAGLLTLSGTNSYTGSTNVNAGTLNAETALNTSALNVAANAIYLNTGGLINPNVTISNNGIVTLFGNEQASIYDSVGGTLNGAGTLTAPTYNLRDGANTTQGVNLGTGVLNSRAGTVTLLGNSAANDVNVLGGTLQVGGNLGNPGATVDISGGATLELLANPALLIDGDIVDTAIVNNAGTLTLAGDDLIASYTSGGPVAGNGLLNGTGTLKAATYALNDNSETRLNANLGDGVLTSNGNVLLGGTSGAETVNIQTGNLTLGTADRLANDAVVNNDAALTLNGDDTVGTYTSTGDLNGNGTLTAVTYSLNDGSDVNANIGLGALTSNGFVTLNGTSAAGIVNIQTGTLTLGFADSLANNAAVNNDATLVLNGDDLVGTYTSTGNLNGMGTLTASTYFLNSGSAVNANIGTGTVQSNGNVALNGTSSAGTVNIQTGNLTLGSTELLNNAAVVTNAGTLTLNGLETVGTYNAGGPNLGNGLLSGSGTLVAAFYNLNDHSTIGAGTTLGSGQLTTTGQVQLDGTSNAEKVTIASGSSLNGAGALNYDLLEGNGTLNRSLTNLLGQTVSPGIGSESIGQLTITGDFTNQGDLVIDLNAQDGAFNASNVLSSANADRLVVNGAGGTNLKGGHVEFNRVAGSREFNAGESALVVASVAPITMDAFTTFDSSDYVGRMFFDVRNGTVVGAGVDAPEDLGELVGLTENQIAIAEAADFNISANDLLDNTLDADKIALAIVGAYNGNTSAALNQLSPESYAGMTDYSLFVTKAYTTAALSMPGTSVDGTVKSVRIPMGTTAPAPAPAPVRTATTSVFAGFAHYDIGTDSSRNNADFDINSNGGIAGVRHEIADFTIAGFVGIDQGDISSPTLRADADGFTIGAIASYMIQPEMNLLATGGITYGSFEYDGSRQSLLGTVDFNADSDVFDVHFGIEADAYRAENFRLSPYAQVHYVTADTAGFTESGNGSALLVRGMDEDALFAQIGVKAEYQVTSRFSVNGNVGYTHNFMDSDRQVSAALGGAAFTVNSPGLGEDFVTLGVGAQFQATDALRFGVNYRTEFSNDAEAANAISVGASYSF